MHAAWFGVLVNEPGRHAAHVRSAMTEPALTTYDPLSHAVHIEHDDALATTLKVPLSQLTHARSEVFEPVTRTRSPGTHGVQATQGVAGLWSWSHVPEVQRTACSPPPAQ